MVLLSAERAGVTRGQAYEWRNLDPLFAEAWQKAIDTSWEDLRDSGYKRAKKKSDHLWLAFAKAKWPEEFAHRDEDLKSNPQFQAISRAFVQVLKEFVPKEQFNSAFMRFGILIGQVEELVVEASVTEAVTPVTKAVTPVTDGNAITVTQNGDTKP